MNAPISMTTTPRIPRILIVDDNRAIHDDFRKILSPTLAQSNLDASEALLFGAQPAPATGANFRIDSAYQGTDAVQMVEEARREGQPYEMAFMDVRMPPGLDGIETTFKIWQCDPDLQIVLCTAYSDYSWNDLLARLGPSDRLVILKKPFDNIEALQLAHALTEKWRLLQQTRGSMANLETMVKERTERLEREAAERIQVEAALRESQQMLLRQERLAAVGQLSAGVAHDFNNIMTVIQGHAGLLLLNDQLPQFAHSPLREIEKAVGKAANLTHQLLAFSRKQVLQQKNIDLGQITRNMAAMLERAIGEEIVLQLTQAGDIPSVLGDAGMMEQVLMNLAVNARDAMPEGGELTIGVKVVEVNAEKASRNPEAHRGKFVCLDVRDTGCGMEKKILDHIFEPFFTTKDVGQGTGLGLATVYGIVKQHNGWIEVESTLGTGTLFRVFLPATEDESSLVPTVKLMEEQVTGGNGETILVVEDEPALRCLVRRILQRYGYEVIEAQSGREALDLWSRESSRIDLLLTDLVMPHGISGKQLARTLAAEKPDLKVVFMSGYDKKLDDDSFSLQPGINFLFKPYNPVALAQVIRRQLDTQRAMAA
jgi:two-component system, NtrC family, sensor kinase